MIKPFTSPSVCASQVGQLIINVTWKIPIRPVDWSQYVKHVAPVALTWTPQDAPCVFSYLPFEGPNAPMRSEITAEPHGKALDLCARVALCTESAVARGALTAIGWMSRAHTIVKPFRVIDRDEALTWLAEVAVFERAEVLAEISRMVAHLQAQ